MRARAAWVVLGLVLGVVSTARAYFLDKGRNFDVRGRFYSGLNVSTEAAREGPVDFNGKELRHVPDFSPGDIFSQRNFYNPEFDAKLTDYFEWMRTAPGLSLMAPEDFKFR